MRFILKRTIYDAHSGMRTENFFTVDAAVPFVESRLNGGGYGENGFDHTQFLVLRFCPRRQIERQTNFHTVRPAMSPGLLTATSTLPRGETINRWRREEKNEIALRKAQAKRDRKALKRQAA